MDAIHEYESETSEISRVISGDVGEEIVWKPFTDILIPDDNNEATINGYGEAEDIELDFSEISYYGTGQFGIPFTLKIFVTAFYYIFKSDFYQLENDGGHFPSVTDHNDHYFEAEDEFEVDVMGMASISIDRDNIDLSDISACIDSESISIDDIDSVELCKS